MYEFKYTIYDADGIKETIETDAPEKIVTSVVKIVMKTNKRSITKIIELLMALGFKK